MQLSPKSAIPVSYTASIPGDTTLYYVQAVLRDTASSIILQTLDLVRESSTPNRYVGSFEPISDPSGLGRPVDITTTVYNDAGYSDPSLNYQILQLSYVVLQPFIANLGNGGGGSNVSYDKIAATVLAALEAAPKKDDAQRVIGAIDNIPKTQIDYARLESLCEQLLESSKMHAETSAESVRSDMRSMIEDLRAELLQKHTESEGRISARMDALEGTVGMSDDRHSQELGASKDQILTDVRKFFEAIKNENISANDSLHARTVNDISDKFLETLPEREVHVHLNMGAKEKKGEKTARALYDPNKILQDLLA